mgnify:CR=1 FL=1
MKAVLRAMASIIAAAIPKHRSVSPINSVLHVPNAAMRLIAPNQTEPVRPVDVRFVNWGVIRVVAARHPSVFLDSRV